MFGDVRRTAVPDAEGGRVDPAEISTLPELAAALAQLRREQSVQAQADAAKNPSPRIGRRPALPRSTASDLLKAKSVPTAETVVTFLVDCGVRGEESQRPWLQALERVATEHQRRPPTAVRVRDARPRMLGVHAAIQTAWPPEDAPSGSGEDELPLYVPRDFDADLRTKLTRATQQGGFVLLVGDSSVGKTRALFEAMQAVVPDWWLLHPGDAAVLQEFAVQPTGRTVVWLDELQDYLDHPTGVWAGQVRALIAAGVVLAATCWPGEHSKRVALPEKGRPDQYANDRRLLGLADVVHVPSAFSAHERGRAEELANTDPRVRVALDTPDAGFTQVLAGGPELIRHWEQAPDDQCYGKAVITAALDARRVGAHAPLTRDYLADAAPGYLNDREVATAPPDWLENALNYAIKLLHGATAALTPVPAGMGTIAGYQVADYLHQHALHARRRQPLPDIAWRALIRYHHPDDTHRVADNAERRGRDHEALTLSQQLADRGGAVSAYWLAKLLAEQGHVEQLRARADNGERFTAAQLARLLAEQGQVNELRARTDNGDRFAAYRLADLLAEQRQLKEAIQVLRPAADKGDDLAAYRLAELLAEQGQIEDALQVLRPHADNGDTDAAYRLAGLLAQQGQVEQLRAHADNGDRIAAYRLADLLVEQGQIEEAIQIMRSHANSGDGDAAIRLADLLAQQGQVEQLRAHADDGDRFASDRLAWLLAEQGQVEQLRARADNGDSAAAVSLAGLLAEQEQFEDAIRLLRLHANNDCWNASVRLAELLAELGQVEQLRARADNGDTNAANRLTELLANDGQIAELEGEVAAGTVGAVAALRRVQSRVSSPPTDRLG
jgi:predicted negative regulator of RcsB-dependent stress response